MPRKEPQALPPIFVVQTKRGFHSSRQKKPKGYGCCVTNLVEFCKRTELHGYKYIVMKELSVPERVCWGIAVFASVVFACYFVITAYHWYARNPIITVIESTHGAIWDVPFPAVTICDLNIVSRKEAEQFSKNVQLPENVTRSQLFGILRLAPLLLTTVYLAENQRKELATLQTVLDLNNYTIADFFNKLSSKTCQDLVIRCMWKNSIYDCNLLFRPVFTQFSVCCTFNYYAFDDGTNSSFSSAEFEVPSAPRRVASCGYQTALTVLIDPDPNDYYSAIIASYGVLVIIDNAYNLPNLNSPMRMVSPSTEVFIALSPERTYSTAGIKAFPPKERQCYFNNEVKLGRFVDYSYQNCIVYQQVLHILRNCGCTPVYLPLDEGDRLCNFTDVRCIEDTRRALIANPDKTINGVECLPDCEHYDYPLEVALGILATDADLSGLDFYRGLKLENRSLLNIFFNDLVITRYRRDVYLNWQNLLASFGGLLSLMLGFTLVSAFDLVIFFSFRIGNYVCRLVKERRKPAPELAGSLKQNKVYVQGMSRDQWWVTEKNPVANRK